MEYLSVKAVSLQDKSVAVIVVLGAIILPVCMSFVLLTLVVLFYSKMDVLENIFYGIYCALILAMINSTKVPVSDLLEYKTRYLLVPEKKLLEYTFYNFGVAAREPVYNILTYFGYWITGGNFKIYIFLTSFLVYFLQFKAIQNFGRRWGVSAKKVLIAMAILAFFGPYFSISAHILRQVIAVSIVVFAFSIFESRRNLSRCFLFLAILVHSSVIVFVPFFFFRSLRERLTVRVLVYVFVFALICSFFGSVFLVGAVKVFSGLGSLSYVLERASNIDSLVEVGGVKSGKIYTYGAVTGLVLCVFIYFRKRKDWSGYALLNSTIFLSSIIYASKEISLVQYRYFFIMYSFFPVIYLMLPEVKFAFEKICVFVVVAVLAFSFVLHLEGGAWTYVGVNVLAITNVPIFMLFYWW